MSNKNHYSYTRSVHLDSLDKAAEALQKLISNAVIYVCEKTLISITASVYDEGIEDSYSYHPEPSGKGFTVSIEVKACETSDE